MKKPSVGLIVFTALTAIPMDGTMAQQPMNPKDAVRFCDVGFRFVSNGIGFDIDKLVGLKLNVDPKVIQAVTSVAAIQITAMTLSCRMVAIGLRSSEQFTQDTREYLQYAKDLEAVRIAAERAAGDSVSKKLDPHLDAQQVATNELGLTIERSLNVNGELQVVLRNLAERYSCTCHQVAR